MSYRCQACGRKVPPKEPLRRFSIYTERLPRQIVREVPVCGTCDLQLKSGTPLDALIEEHQRYRAMMKEMTPEVLRNSLTDAEVALTVPAPRRPPVKPKRPPQRSVLAGQPVQLLGQTLNPQPKKE